MALEEVATYADWIELCSLFSDEGVFARDEAEDILLDGGLLGLSEEELYAGDPSSFVDDTVMSDRDAAGRFAEEIWRTIEERKRQLGDAYPFTISREVLLERQSDDWQNFAAYGMLLVSDVGRHYSDSNVNLTPNTESGKLFEKIVEAAAVGLLRGVSQRFGWPRESGWPTGISERIERLSEEISLVTEELTGKTNPTDNDRGLDVVARLDVGGDGAGSLFVLLQCAAGKNWKDKSGEPQLANWNDILQWKSVLIRGVALPWKIPADGLWDFERHWRHFDSALILDRMRLSHGMPDQFLEGDSRNDICDWCRDRIDELPKVA